MPISSVRAGTRVRRKASLASISELRRFHAALGWPGAAACSWDLAHRGTRRGTRRPAAPGSARRPPGAAGRGGSGLPGDDARLAAGGRRSSGSPRPTSAFTSVAPSASSVTARLSASRSPARPGRGSATCAARRAPRRSVAEAVVFRGEYGLEQYFRVEGAPGQAHVALDARRARAHADGRGRRGVDFAGSTRSAGIRVQPAAIFDSSRRNVTPADTRWTLERSGRPGRSRWSSTTPTSRSRTCSTRTSRDRVQHRGSAGSVTGLTIRPGGNVGDILVAEIAVRNNATVTAPGGWTLDLRATRVGRTGQSFLGDELGRARHELHVGGHAHAAGVISAYSDVHSTLRSTRGARTPARATPRPRPA